MTSTQVADEEWAQRVQRLGPEARARRAGAVGVLLEEPEDISDPLETELYILRDHLTGPQGADQEKTSEAAEEEWAQRVRRLSPEARARRADAVSVLLEEPGDISGTLESELHILLGHLKGQAG